MNETIKILQSSAESAKELLEGAEPGGLRQHHLSSILVFIDTDSTARQGMLNQINVVLTRLIPLLKQTAPAVAVDPHHKEQDTDPEDAGQKWIGTARAVESELKTIVDEATLSRISFAIDETEKYLAAIPGRVLDAALDALKKSGAGPNPVPWGWIIGVGSVLLGLAWFPSLFVGGVRVSKAILTEDSEGKVKA